MSRLSILAIFAFVAGAVLSETPLSAQEPVAQVSKIVTADGVRLNAVFYPSGKKTSATVIMLHPIGDGKSIKSQDWKSLATSLQKGGYSVMMFDFRGHGESTTIDDPKLFWTLVSNRSYVKSKDKESIDVKDFIRSPQYLPILVNDIAAVKAFLDRKNDAGECNTGSTIIVGADNGGTLGAIWMNSEWNRYKFLPPINMFAQGELSKVPEGNDVIAAIFLTIQPNLDSKRPMSIAGILRNPCLAKGTPALFFYGKDDPEGKRTAVLLESKLKPTGTAESKKHKYIGKVELNTKLTGMKLLQDSLKTSESITQFLDKIVEERGNEWVNRESEKTLYMWRNPNGSLVPARAKKDEKNLRFDTYDKFITN